MKKKVEDQKKVFKFSYYTVFVNYFKYMHIYSLIHQLAQYRKWLIWSLVCITLK